MTFDGAPAAAKAHGATLDCNVTETLRQHLLANSARLYNLAELVSLIGFACEARRVLDEVYLMTMGDASFASTLSDGVEHWADWTEHKDTAGVVARDISNQMREIAEQTDLIRVHLARAEAASTEESPAGSSHE